MPNSTDIDRLIDEAIARHAAADAPAATDLCVRVLAADPDNVEALNLLGVLRQDEGTLDEALRLIDRALALDPDYGDAWANRARALNIACRWDDARAAAEQATRLAPDLPAAWYQCGLAALWSGDTDAAADAFERAAALDPDAVETSIGLAEVAKRRGDHPAVQAALTRVLAARPDHVDSLTNLAVALLSQDQVDDAIPLLRRALAIAPDNGPALLTLAQALYLQRYEFHELEALCHRLLDIAPNREPVLKMLAAVQGWLGRIDDAKATYAELARHDPEHARSMLLALTTEAGETQDLDELRQRFANTALPVLDRAATGFALGKLLDRAGEHDAAFAAWSAANALNEEEARATGRTYDRAELMRYVEWNIREFKPALFETIRPHGDPSDLPVFIVGMPRSGTSLVEQICASHARVHGGGERRDIEAIMARVTTGSSTTIPLQWDLARMREETRAHVAHLRALGGDALRVTDKMPDNLFYLGQISLLFPNARIIICKRDMRDVCLSCFTSHFTDAVTWSNTLESIGFRAVQYQRILAHWRAIVPNPILEVDYESLIAAPEAESRRLIDFLGLDWDPACLDFHKNTRGVATVSYQQVRRPIYDSSIGRWRRYERQLAPLLDIIEGRRVIAVDHGLPGLPSALPRTPPATTFLLPPAALFERARQANRAQRWPDAVAALERVLADNPDHRDALNELAFAKAQLKDWPAALQALERSVVIDPIQPAAWRNAGKAMRAVGALDHAVTAFERALVLDPASLALQAEIGDTLYGLGRFQDSADRFAPIAEKDPLYACGLGCALWALGRHDAAHAAFDRALARSEAALIAGMNKALLLLSQGRFAEGFALYDRRSTIPGMTHDLVSDRPLWRGDQPIDGKTLYIHWEQGYGDTIQFSRFAETLADRGARVILGVQRPLARLLRRLPGAPTIVTDPADIPPHDLRCPTFDLLRHLCPDIDAIPQARPYLSADPALAALWRDRLGPRAHPRIGLVWAGALRPDDTQAIAMDSRRSLPLSALAPLAEIPGCGFVSLQLGPPASQAADPPPGMTLLDLTADIEDFADTAALIDNLDLVISVDTATAHLAGALGKPVWQLDRHHTDWRWEFDPDQSLWYPALRHFRQPTPGDWTTPIRHLKDALNSFVATGAV